MTVIQPELDIPLSPQESASAIHQTADCERPQTERRSDALRPIHFDGSTYEPVHDHGRLTSQLARVLGAALDGRWRTLAELAQATGDPESSVSARLRDLRKPKFGAHVVERRRRGEAARGLFEYRVVRE